MPERSAGLPGAARAVLGLALLTGGFMAFSAGSLLARALALILMCLLAGLWWMLARQRLPHTPAPACGAPAAPREATPTGADAAAFIASMGHDLRQPMQAISLFAAALAAQKLPEAASAQVQGIEDAAAQLSAQLEAVFAIARLRSGRSRPDIAAVSLDSVLASVIALRLDDAQDAGLHLRHVATQRRLGTDAQLLLRLLDSLVSHALRNTPHGGVVLGCRAYAGGAAIEVWDSGRGVAPAQVAQVFEAGSDYGRLWPDKGLGLALAAEIAHRLGGRLSLRSVPGRGSVWRCELPPLA